MTGGKKTMAPPLIPSVLSPIIRLAEELFSFLISRLRMGMSARCFIAENSYNSHDFQIQRIEDKGKDYGSYIKSGEFVWFVRETGSSESRRGTVIFIHGAPAQSYSYRVVMAQMADAGFHCFAPDWIGFGFSDKPQPGYGFNYTEEEFHVEFNKILDALDISSPFFLVVQGFLVGSYGLTWALKNPSRVSKLAILNSPLTDTSPVPGLFQQLRFSVFLLTVMVLDQDEMCTLHHPVVL
ncbi:uncharacterized protein LOC122072085 isoform X2 [Macadamia integrifolia]|uniref:uncharacterized protein LOC122072085 isoform X2 n=1 Tax=Macadamia integrifolia TaxID=60698 RepID=UPI001C4EC78B|nr:uncharacterized protein LOC122072085 isoform X2 [Macadamia integrifolia]